MLTKASDKCVKFLKDWERLVLRLYVDACGHLTIGYGHLVLQDQLAAYRKGIDFITAERLLKQDMKAVEALVAHTTQGKITEQYQFDALVSFVFNCGGTAFLRSTLLKDIQAGKLEEVPKEMMRWVHGDHGEEILGLVNRRKAEVKMWNGTPIDQLLKAVKR